MIFQNLTRVKNKNKEITYDKQDMFKVIDFNNKEIILPLPNLIFKY